MEKTDHKYLIALQLIQGIGPTTIRRLVEHFGSAKAVFEYKPDKTRPEKNINPKLIRQLTEKKYLEQAEEELNFCLKHNIKVLAFTDGEYPQRLKHCKDAPAIIYYQGNVDLNYRKTIGIVGTRNATVYGSSLVEKFIEELAQHKHNAMIISGLAYGIDVVAHKAAMNNNLPTVGIMGSGSDIIYPSVHKSIVKRMLPNGGIITEFAKGTKPDRGNFVSRNRIIAGMCDALIVAESGEKGGALISADMAFSYNRDVFAFPGKVGDTYSAGCNKLIKQQKAALLESVTDFEYFMNWPPEQEMSEPVQASLFDGLSTEERTIFELIMQDGTIAVDYMAAKLALPVSQLSGILLSLELKNKVKSLPGNQYTKAF